MHFDALDLLRASGVRTAGCRVTTKDWDPDQLAGAFAAARDGWPTSYRSALMTGADRRSVAALAARYEVTVVVDEPMRELDLRDRRPASAGPS
ncbi:hypothetical protein [Streptomyces sp. NPDC003077]|uniref:hypothetical protein n=1 Tax=Streptomyces sp. NPDC003077 TaxID=3154443 RepID=UPI0033B7B6B0